MKKILLCIGAMTIFACSGDSDISNPSIDNPSSEVQTLLHRDLPIENEIDEMFSRYVKSAQFINYDLASREFYSKLNINASNIESFKSSSSIVGWVSANLDNTDFGSMSIAISQWENIVNLKGEELEAFPEITAFVLEKPMSVSLQYFKKWVFGPYDNRVSATCKDDYDQCNNDADTHHMHNTMHYLSSTTGKDRSEIMGAVNQRYMADLHYCQSVFDKCIGLTD